MSFGGGREQYILEYLVKVTPQGASAGAFSQVSNGIKQVDMATKQATVSQEQLIAAQNKVAQSRMGVSKALKGMAFGFIGIATAGAEAAGMLSMWQSTQEGVQQAQADVNAALKEGGKDSKQYKDATQELTKAQRWQRMTMRNLVLSFFDLVPFILLSINGMKKNSVAAKQLRADLASLKVIQDGLSTSNAKLAASNEAANASQLSIVKGSKSVATAEKAAAGAVIPLTGALSGMSVAAVASEGKMSRLGAAGAKIKGSFISVGAAIGAFAKRLLPIAAIIGTIIVAVEAWKNNWGGFGDAINKVGVAIGNIHPALKMLMEGFAKVGLTIDALLHGNFDELKKIWAGAPKEGPIKTMTKAEEKAAEEWEKTVNDVQSRALDLMDTLAQADKKERGGLLKAMGFKGKAKDELNDVFNGINKVQDAFGGLTDTLQTMAQIDILGDNFGLKIDKNKFSKALFTLEDRIGEAAKKTFKKGSTGRKLLDGLSDALHKDAKSKNPQNAKAVGEYLVNHPEVLKLMKESGVPQDVIDVLSVKMKAAADKKAAELKAERARSLKKMTPQELKIFQTAGGFMTPEEEDKWWDENLPEGDTGDKKINELFASFQKSITDGLAALKTSIETTDWAQVGTTVRTALLNVFNINNAQNLGQFLRNNVLNPLIGALQGVFGPWIAQLQADPIKTLLGTANAIGAPIAAFVAGLFGFQDEAAMDKAMLEGMQMFSAKIIHAVDNFVNNTPWLWDLLHGDIIGMFIEVGNAMGATASKNIQQSQLPDPDMSKVIDPTITGIINKSWLRAEFWLQKNQWLTELFSGNPVPMIWEFMKNSAKQGKTAGVVTGIPVPKVDVKGIIDKYITGPITTFFNGIGNDDNVKALVAFIKDPITGIIALGKFIKSEVVKAAAPIPQLNIQQTLDKYVWQPISSAWKIYTTRLKGNPVIQGIWNIINGANNTLQSILGEIFHGPAEGATTSDSGTNGNNINTKITVIADTKAAQSSLGSIQISLDGIAASAQAMDSIVSESLNSMTGTAQVDAGMIKDTFASSFGEVDGLADTLASDWSTDMNSFGSNAESGGSQVVDALDSAFGEVESLMDTLAHDWSAVCNSLGANARSAAKQITSALNSIPTKITTIHEIRTVNTTGSAGRHQHGGVFFANKATSAGTFGEAGPELAMFIPLSNSINKLNTNIINNNGRSSRLGDSSKPVKIHIHNHLLERDVQNIINIDKGRMMSKYGA